MTPPPCVQHRNKLNDQQNSRLAAQHQLLQQRKDEVSKMDNRILELQQRLKKRRSQQQQQQQKSQQQQPQPAATTNSEDQQQKNLGSRPGQLRKPGQNIAAVEPYIQYAPKEVAKDDLYSKTGFLKHDPKYQTLPPNTKFIPSGEEGSKPGGVVVVGGQEVNNNNNNKSGGGGGGGGVSGVRPVEYKIPSIISSHFDANRGRVGAAGNRTAPSAADNQGRPSGAGTAAGGSAVPKPAAPPATQGLGFGSNSQQQPLVNSVAKGPRPFVNTFGKPGLPKWPPEPVKDDEQPQQPAQLQQQQQPAAAPPQQQHHQPQINIFDEERQAGSGQSSPASSEGSGPLVKQGSGVFTHPQAASAQIPPPGVGANQTAQGPPVDSRGNLPGRQGPKPPPRMPQGTVSVKPVASSAAGQGVSRPAVVDSRTGGRDEVDSSKLSVSDSVSPGAPQATSTPNGSNVQTPAGADGKTGTTIHLNQRPAPTYRSELSPSSPFVIAVTVVVSC